MIKYLFWVISVIALLICISDWIGVSQEIYGAFVFPYPHVRLPILILSSVFVIGAWINAYPTGEVKDLFKKNIK